ncbi:kinase-like protein [Ceratobasidium sp. AG-I]|nr:kinase-like protein [Ceratobasidium sp. AG-I]
MSVLPGTSVRDLTEFISNEPYPKRIGGFSDIYKGDLDERPTRRTWDILRWLSPDTRRVDVRYKIFEWISPGTRRVEVAIKVIRMDPQMAPEDGAVIHRKMMNEVTIWHDLNHLNVLPLLGIIQGLNQTPLPALVSPWYERGNVSEYITRASPPPADRVSLMLQVVSAIDYLHSRNPPIVHGDLKSQNFLLRSDYLVQLSDFGLSRIPQDGAGSRFSSSNDGTTRWMGPELFAFSSTDSIVPVRALPSDIWALGCTLYEIVTSLEPYHECRTVPKIIHTVCRRSTPTKPTNTLSPGLAQLQKNVWPVLEQCWNYNPDQRPDIRELACSLREVILLNHIDLLYGPTFNYPVDKPSPSVIGEDEPYALERQAESESDMAKARAFLVAAAIGYHSQRTQEDYHRAFVVQVQLGWNLISQNFYADAQAHFQAAYHSVQNNYQLFASCLRGFGEISRELGDLAAAIGLYTLALEVIRQGDWVKDESAIARALGNNKEI